MDNMNITAALLHENDQYRNSFLHSFNEFYPQTEIYTFSKFDIMAAAVSHKPADVLLISENIYNAKKEILLSGKIRCKAVIILTNGRGINKLGNYPAVCQYQSVDDLYREMINIYASSADALLNITSRSGRTKVSTFISGAGGCGCSVSAAAYSVYLAANNNKVIYIDMSSLGMPEFIFSDKGNYTMTDCFTAVLSRKNNLNVQLETYAKKDISGVYFYPSCVNSLDWKDITLENKTDLLDCIMSESSYDHVVVDLPCIWDDMSAFMYERSDRFYVVSDGKASSNEKTKKMLDTIFTYVRSNSSDPSKVKAVYSAYSEKSVKLQDDRVDEYAVLHEIKKYNNIRELLEKLSSPDIWRR